MRLSSTGGQRHEVPSRGLHDEHAHRILELIDSNPVVTQRSLARDVGVALGLTNLLVRRMVKRGFVRVVRVKPRRLRYLVTPAGLAEKARMSQSAWRRSIERYCSVRDRTRAALLRHSADWPTAGEPARLVFFGGGEIAEIVYVCVQGTGLVFTAAVDDRGPRELFGRPVYPVAEVPDELRRSKDVHFIVTSLRPMPAVRADLRRAGIPESRVTWI
jgi:DNA-binding MarR family transcriptional regulator